MANRKSSVRKPNVTLFALLGVGILALVAVVVGLASGGDDDDDTAGSETRAIEYEGDPLATYDRTVADASIGTPAPVVHGETFAGEAISIPAGEPALVVFVAHWCPHCQREVPFLVSYFEANGFPDDVAVYGVATGIDPAAPNYPTSEWLEAEGWTIPTLVDADDDGAGVVYGLSSYPYFVAIDADGNVAARVAGELQAPQLEALFDAARGA